MLMMTNGKKVFTKVTLINYGPVANDSEQKAIDRLESDSISKLGDGEWIWRSHNVGNKLSRIAR